MQDRVLIAGVGNIFLGDDGFGVEVVNRLRGRPLPEGVRAADFGIRGIHLAYELLDRPCELLVLVDAMPRGDLPGTLYVMAPDLDEVATAETAAGAHGMTPDAVFQTLRALGGELPEVRIVGCEPQVIDEAMGLSPSVGAAVDGAVEMVMDVVARHLEREAQDARVRTV